MKKKAIFPFFMALLLCACGAEPDSPDNPDVPGGDPEVKTITDEEYAAMTDSEYMTNFLPIIRFTIASDLHIHDSDTESNSYYKRVIKLCTMSYQEAEKEENNYKKLDAILIAGDMVDNGKVSQYQKVKNIFDTNMKEGTKLITTTGNHDYWSDRGQTLTKYLSVFTDQQADQRIVINDTDFISIVPANADAQEEAHFNLAKQTWLRQQLRQAQTDHPGKPIFVMSHYPQFNTVYGSWDTHFGTDDLDEVFVDYPQVVYIAGHSHFPIADPRSLYQKDYTCINTGTTAYTCLQINDKPGYDVYYYPSDLNGGIANRSLWSGESYELGDMQILEVDKFGAIKIKGYDLRTSTHIFDRLIRYPADKTKFLTNEMKYEQSVAPEFDSEASLKKFQVTKNQAIYHIPASISDEYVESYRTYLYDSEGTLLDKFYCLGDEYLWPNPTKFVLKITGLTANTEYTIKTYAVNAYNKLSTKPLIATFTTKAS